MSNINALLAQGFNPQPAGMRANALMQMQQIEGAQQKNALMQFQMQQAQAEQAALQQRGALAAQQRAAQDAFLQGMQPVSGIQANAASGVTGPRPAALAAIGQRPAFDPIAAKRAGFDDKTIEFLANAGTLGMPEVARTIEADDGKGGKETRQVDRFGRQVGGGLPGYIAPVQVNQGNQVTFTRPTAGLSLPVGMSSYERDASARGWAGVNLQRDSQNKPIWDATNQGFVDPKTRTFTPATGPDGKALPGKAVAATEDERKAAGWLAQADNAWKNMLKVAFDANGNLQGAAKPGLNDALAAVPSFGAGEAAANFMRSKERQQFMQGASSLSEALLRAATGAGVNQDEARQKIREVTPVFGDDADTIKQKMDAVPMYLDSLKSRAGRAVTAPYAPPMPPTSASNVAPPLQMPADPNEAAIIKQADIIIRGGR